MSEVKQYTVLRGQLIDLETMQDAYVYRLVSSNDYWRLEEEHDALRAQVEALRNRRVMLPTEEVLRALEEARAFTTEHDSGRAGVLRGMIDAILRCKEVGQ